VNKNKSAKILADLTSRLSISYQLKNFRIAEKYGLLTTELRCLDLMGFDKGLSNRGLSKRMNLSESRVTRVVEGLVNKGYINRKRNLKSHRFVSLSLTDKGKRFNTKMMHINSEALKVILQDLNKTERKLLLKEIKTLKLASDQWVKKPFKNL
jgi:DNA-binding MarR family transcriptional regulator